MITKDFIDKRWGVSVSEIVLSPSVFELKGLNKLELRQAHAPKIEIENKLCGL